MQHYTRSAARFAVVSLAALASALGGCTKKQESPAAGAPARSQTQPADATAPTKPDSAAIATSANQKVDLMTDSNGLSKSTVVMKTSKGTIKFKFYSKDAPNTVARFVELVQSKFYNGLAFHRVVPGFVVQTGDPKSRNKSDPTIGTGGSGTKLKAEFSSRKHVRGSVAMARATDPDSADSQFYVCYGSFPHLDGKYTVIGQVVDFGEKIGEKDVLDRIMQWDEVTGMTIE